MTTRKLVKKFELYIKLQGGLDRQDLTVTDCTKCILKGVCIPDVKHRPVTDFRRFVFIKCEEGQPPKIIGWGHDFGMKDYEEKDGKILFHIVKGCMEWLDQEPRIFDK